jgi:tetratricopeptide (TPR) repeat protein
LVNQQNTLGSKHPKLLPTLIGLADYYKDQNKLLDAEQLYHRALTIAETSLPPEHPDLASCLYRLARIYHLKHDYAKAEVFYQKELRILRHNKSPDEEIQGTIKRLVEVLKASGKTSEAKELQQKI